MARSDDYLDAANAIVAVAGIATASPAVAGAGSALKAAGLFKKIVDRAKGGTPKVNQSVAAALADAFDNPRSHLPTDADKRRLLRQMLEQVDVTPAAVINAERDTKKLCAAMRASLTKSEFKIAGLATQFDDLVTPVLGKLLSDTEIADQLRPVHEAAVLQILQDIQGKVDVLTEQFAETTKKLGFEMGFLVTLARRIAPSVETVDQARPELERAIEIAIRQGERGTLPANHDEAVDAVIAEADRLTRDGELDRALAGLLDNLDAQRAEAERQHAEAERKNAARARVRERTLDAAILARSVAGAVAVVLDGLPDGAGRFAALRAAQDEWYARGRDRGLAFDLEVAIALAGASREMAQDADERGAALNDLGTALQTLGARESGTARLEEAVAAYTGALKERTRDRVPLDWAATQNNLGAALTTLGERESGTARLEAAVTAYTEALKEYTRDRVPLDWAMTQNNLGNALATLGARESGTARLEEAVTAYTEALKEWTRNRVPLDWAMTQNNLGNALRTLGARESGTDRLEAAVAACTEALKELTRDRVPLDWAITQNNLALVEMALYARTGDAALPDRAAGRLAGAAEVFGAAGATHYAGMVAEAQARLAAMRAGDA